MTNVEVYRESEVGADDVLAAAADHVVVATGATWRRDGFGRFHPKGIADLGPPASIFTPDDIMAGRLPEGRVIVFDDDHYYMGPVVAELLVTKGRSVILATPAQMVGAWSVFTVEQARTQRRLMDLEVETVTMHGLSAFDGCEAVLACALTGRLRRVAADSLVVVTARQPNDDLYRALSEKVAVAANGAPRSLRRIGDSEAPAIIAAAVYAGHRYARELDSPGDDCSCVPRDRGFDDAA
jgi:dimethylamine/trimethylamine dehydrogenase